MCASDSVYVKVAKKSSVRFTSHTLCIYAMVKFFAAGAEVNAVNWRGELVAGALGLAHTMGLGVAVWVAEKMVCFIVGIDFKKATASSALRRFYAAAAAAAAAAWHTIRHACTNARVLTCARGKKKSNRFELVGGDVHTQTQCTERAIKKMKK